MLKDLEIQNILQQAEKEFKQARDSLHLYQIQIKYLGKQGKIRELMQKLAQAPVDEKPVLGQKINELKNEIENKYQDHLALLKKKELEEQISRRDLDLTLAGPWRSPGGWHPIEKIIKKTCRIFEKLGYIQVAGPFD